MSADVEIDALFAEWKAAVASSDPARILALITDDAEFWTHGAPALGGRDAAEALYRDFFKKYELRQDFEEIERIVAGEFAFIRGTESNVLTPKDGGAPVEVKQRAFTILRKEHGRWRFARGMTNRAS